MLGQLMYEDVITAIDVAKVNVNKTGNDRT
jgi:hypothetical protein